jgi:hypothetical protein
MLHFTPVSKLSFGVEVGSVTKQQVSGLEDVLPQDDLVQPFKIFRNLTSELEASACTLILKLTVSYLTDIHQFPRRALHLLA